MFSNDFNNVTRSKFTKFTFIGFCLGLIMLVAPNLYANQDAASMDEYENLLSTKKIARSIIWYDLNAQNIFVLRNYSNWSEAEKDELKAVISDMEAGKDFPLTRPPKIVEEAGSSFYISKSDAWMIFLTHVAHSLWIEVNGNLGWSLTKLSGKKLKALFDSRLIFFGTNRSEQLPKSGSGYRYQFSMGNTDWNVRFSYDFLLNNGLIKKSARETVYAFMLWGREHLRHYSYLERTKEWRKSTYGYEGPIPIDLILEPPSGVDHISSGCGGASSLFRAVMSSINIPVVDNTNVFARAGESPTGHYRFELPSLKIGVAHGDDIYNAILQGSVGNVVPVKEMFVKLTWLKKYIDNPALTHTKNKAEQALYNTRKRQLNVAIKYFARWLLRQRIGDYVDGKYQKSDDIEEALTGIDGLNYKKPLFTNKERNKIIRKVDKEIKRLGGGDWSKGAEIVLSWY